ncbi:SdiA-regulated domain-containing protein [Aromatoleum evansii]|uniref:SdiA-regulated domain-containing protein n=1 Tax=Aromatoleum evansii TaxID=59406 RepID=A0ABZ1AL92_AROEV|nr:SdiA-regulated domain-containing protein [Aromatoleum evansii]
MTPDSRTLALPLTTPWRGALAAAALLGLALAMQQADGGLLDRAFAAAISALKPARAEGTASALSDPRVNVEAYPVAGVARNLSGLAWDAQRGHLWAVVNEPPQLLALDRDGDVLARHPLPGFNDVEGVAVLGDGRLLLAEERRQSLVVAPIPAASDAVLSRDGLPALTLALGGGDNAGIEGVAYDPARDRLFVVKEHSPRKLYEIRGLRASLAGHLEVEVIDREDWIRDKFVARDFSSVEYDPRTGHLILLSDASKLALELDADGRYVGYQGLAAGFAGLAGSIPQAEGVTLDERGNLYVVSEPNLFYAFRPE